MSDSKICEDRAKAVARYLEEKGVSRKRMEVKGYGYTKPKGKADTEGRAMNRRVEIKVIQK
jgi:OmpA-OmpF porin, OOP family